MRSMEFKMERSGLVEEGDKVQVIERKCPANYYYIIEPAVAMSGCYLERERLKSDYGVVKQIKQTERGFYVIVEFDEENV